MAKRISPDQFVNGLCDEFSAIITKLPDMPPAKWQDTVRELCELSRDVMFRIGPVEFAYPGQVQQVSQMFRHGHAVIIGLPGLDDESLDWAGNIVLRAEDLEEWSKEPALLDN